MRITKTDQGTALLISIIVVAVLLMFGAVCFTMVFNDTRVAWGETQYLQTIMIAEAGLERAIMDLRKDYVSDTDKPSWTDGDINGMACGPGVGYFYKVPYSSTTLGNGSYSVWLRNVTGQDQQIWVRSVGTVQGITAGIEAYLKIEDISMWSNAIFAGTGAGNTVINGNVDIRGSVHILGDSLSSTDFAINMSGTANIGNNYDGMDSRLAAAVLPCPQTLFNGKLVDSLGVTVRVKQGLVGLSGTGTVGIPDDPGNALKETLDGVYINDGYGGDKGALNVYADNGTDARYDLSGSFSFPRLSDPYDETRTYMDYLRGEAHVIKDPTQLKELANLTPASKFNYTDPGGKGSLSMDGSGNLHIEGIVYVPGDFRTSKFKSLDQINYTGTGTLVVEGNVSMATNLITKGDQSFPRNIMAIMTPNTITFEASQMAVAGLFYAENTIMSMRQTSVAGVFAANYVDMGTDVPNIYYVPAIRDNLPPGLIGRMPVWYMHTVAWRKFRPSPYITSTLTEHIDVLNGG